MINRRIVLRSRPDGVPQPDIFEQQTATVPSLEAGQLLVRNRLLSVDPAMRIWLGPPGGYVPSVPLGSVVRSFAAGDVVESRAPGFQAGDQVVGLFGWQQYAVVERPAVFWKVPVSEFPLSYSLGVLGINGIAAYIGMTTICQPHPGETVVVSTAAGAVGSCAGQIASILGARAVGIAGGENKCARCINEFGFADAVDYKASPSLDDALAAACPGGIDAFFDNTAGPISDAVRRRLNVGARIALCGTSSIESWSPWPQGDRAERHLLNKRALMQGFVVTDHIDLYPEALAKLGEWLKSGQLRCREHVLQGLDQAPQAIRHLYDGKNDGKLLIQLD